MPNTGERVVVCIVPLLVHVTDEVPGPLVAAFCVVIIQVVHRLTEGPVRRKGGVGIRVGGHGVSRSPLRRWLHRTRPHSAAFRPTLGLPQPYRGQYLASPVTRQGAWWAMP